MKPRLTPRQREVLAWVRAHPDQRTDDMALQLGWDLRILRTVLLALVNHKLVGRQEPLPPEFVSTWRAEAVEEESNGSV